MSQHDDAMMDQEQWPRLVMDVTPSMIISAWKLDDSLWKLWSR
jgi:hypothetical protein